MNPSINLSDNELANNVSRAPTKSSGSPAFTSLVPSYSLLLRSAPIPVPLLVILFINDKLFKNFIEAYLLA